MLKIEGAKVTQVGRVEGLTPHNGLQGETAQVFFQAYGIQKGTEFTS